MNKISSKFKSYILERMYQNDRDDTKKSFYICSCRSHQWVRKYDIINHGQKNDLTQLDLFNIVDC